jgi:hypothetical protein
VLKLNGITLFVDPDPVLEVLIMFTLSSGTSLYLYLLHLVTNALLFNSFVVYT